MRTLPAMMLHLLNPFMSPFSRRVWLEVQVLLLGAFPQSWTGAPLVLHYMSWASGKPGTSSASTASSTVPPGRVGASRVLPEAGEAAPFYSDGLVEPHEPEGEIFGLLRRPHP